MSSDVPYRVLSLTTHDGLERLSFPKEFFIVECGVIAPGYQPRLRQQGLNSHRHVHGGSCVSVVQRESNQVRSERCGPHQSIFFGHPHQSGIDDHHRTSFGSQGTREHFQPEMVNYRRDRSAIHAFGQVD